MKLKSLFLIAFIVTFAGINPAVLQVYGAQSEINRCISKLEKKYESMNDYHAYFTQETQQGSINMVQKAEGEVCFKKGGKMIWHYKTPEVQKIILDGKNLWFYLPEEKQVMKNNFSTIPSHIVVDLFRGKIDIQQKFKIAFIQNTTKNNKTILSIKLIPLSIVPH